MDNKQLDHCGPISHPGLIPSRTEEGVVALQIPKINNTSKPDPWVADWIWLDPNEFPEFQDSEEAKKYMSGGSFAVGLFRKRVELHSNPQNIIAWVSADVKYRLYINGQMVGRGPSQIGGDIDFDQAPNWWFYDTLDLTQYFQVGPNVITAEVLHHRDVGSDLSVGHSGFLFEARVYENKDPNLSVIIKSDSTWRGILGESFLVKTMYDASYDPGQWHEYNYEEYDWPLANFISKVENGKWHLIPANIPPLMEYRYDAESVKILSRTDKKRVKDLNNLLHFKEESKTTFFPGESIKILLEFDREVAGFLQFALQCPKGITLSFGFMERLNKEDFNDLYLSRKGFQTFELFRLRPCQYLRVLIDFSQSEEPQTPVEIYYIGMNFVSYPVQYTGQFRCSNDLLNKIWKVGRWTNQLCMQTYYLDSPVHQEPLGDHGDYMIEALISYYAFGDYGLARHDLIKTIQLLKQTDCRMFHTSYSLLWLQMLVEYYNYSGDESILHDALPIIHRLLERFRSYLGKSGIISEAPNYMFFDWITVDGFNLHHPPSVIGQAYLTAFFYQALKNGAYVCQVCNDLESQVKYMDWANAIAQAFHREFWDNKKQLYCDGCPGITHIAPNKWLPPDPKKTYYSRHTNALAVLYGLVPENGQDGQFKSKELLKRIMNDKSLPIVQPYFMHFVLNAINEAGLFDVFGFSEIQKWKGIMNEHPTSLKESWGFGDYSHAWSGTPTFQLSAHVLGIIPSAPGFRKIRFNPNLGNLEWANGIIPTPHGQIEVSIIKKNGKIESTIKLPPGITIENTNEATKII